MGRNPKRPYKCKKKAGGRLGEYVWMGLFITRHQEDKRFWAVRDVGDYGPTIEGKFKTLSDCCDVIEKWHKVKNKKHLRLVK